MRFRILSNGTLITDDWAASIAATGRCDSIQVSLDGSMPSTHDVFRGNGSFEAAIAGLRSLHRCDVPATVRLTIHRGNVDDLEAAARFLLEEVGLLSFSTNAASHLGTCRVNAERVQLTPQERTRAMNTLLRLSRKYPGRISAQAGPLDEGRRWAAMERARREGKPSLPGRGKLVACGGVMSKIAVRADGVLVPCSQLPHVALGRINVDDLAEVWQNHPELERLRRRREIPLSEFEYCRTCEYMNYCTGGCPALSYTEAGDVYGPSHDSCLRRHLEAGGELPDGLDDP
jgi:SynChlorMet cassette radical SAM/SPASM protein ScmE